MGETAARTSQAPASAYRPGGKAGPTAAAAPREGGRTTDAVRVMVRQPAHRVRGWLTAAPR